MEENKFIRFLVSITILLNPQVISKRISIFIQEHQTWSRTNSKDKESPENKQSIKISEIENPKRIARLTNRLSSFSSNLSLSLELIQIISFTIANRSHKSNALRPVQAQYLELQLNIYIKYVYHSLLIELSIQPEDCIQHFFTFFAIFFLQGHIFLLQGLYLLNSFGMVKSNS